MLKPGKQYGLRTRAIHAGEGPDPVTGASAPNLVMSTTFVLEETASSFSALCEAGGAGYVYTRWANPTIHQLEEKLADLEGGEKAVAFSSGMGAAAGLLFHRLASGDHLVVSDVAYAGVAELVRGTLAKLNIEVSPADLADLDDLRRALRSNTRMVWAETPANPILKLTDICAVADVVHRAGAELVIERAPSIIRESGSDKTGVRNCCERTSSAWKWRCSPVSIPKSVRSSVKSLV
jgi:methionine-gamma-lyase